MPGYADPGFDTLAIHAGAAPVPATGVLEQRVAALEGGIGAIATASGPAALHLCIATLMGSGSHMVASTALCGDAHHLLRHTLRRFGINTTFVAPGDMDAWRAAIRPNTKLLFGETVGGPALDVLDIPTIAAIAHEASVPLLVDSTPTSPWLMQPLALGADLVFHSATPYLCGQGTVMGGVVVDGGSFDWARAYGESGRFAELATPCDGFQGMNFGEENTVGAFLLRARMEGLCDFGACMSPGTGERILQGIETLGLRMERHMRTTEQVVQFLTNHPLISCVNHPTLPTHHSHALAQKVQVQRSVLRCGVATGKVRHLSRRSGCLATCRMWEGAAVGRCTPPAPPMRVWTMRRWRQRALAKGRFSCGWAWRMRRIWWRICRGG